MMRNAPAASDGRCGAADGDPENHDRAGNHPSHDQDGPRFAVCRLPAAFLHIRMKPVNGAFVFAGWVSVRAASSAKRCAGQRLSGPSAIPELQVSPTHPSTGLIQSFLHRFHKIDIHDSRISE